MAPLPENNTARYFVDYTFEGQARSLQVRFASPAGIDSVRAWVGDFLDYLMPMACASWVVTGARVQSKGSPLTFPALAPTLTVAPGGGDLPDNDRPRFLTFVGRGAMSGRRNRLFVYGLVFSAPADWRFPEPVNTNVENALALLRAAQEDMTFLTIAEDATSWYEYQNVGFNDHWIAEARRS